MAKDIGIACVQGYFIGRPAEKPTGRLPGSGPAERARRIEYAPAGAEQLRVTLATLDETARAFTGERPVGLADECREILRAQLQLPVELGGKVRGEALVEEEARGG